MVIRPPRAQYDPSRVPPRPSFPHRRRGVPPRGRRPGGRARPSPPLQPLRPEIRIAAPLALRHLPPGNSGSRCDAVDAVRLLLPAGISVFALDLGGSGISEGEHVTLGVARDARRRRRRRAPPPGGASIVGIWGRSMGAVTALLYANRDPSIAGIVLDSPFSSLTGLMSELVDDFVSASYGARAARGDAIPRSVDAKLHQSARRVRHTRPGRHRHRGDDALPRVVRARRGGRFHPPRAFRGAVRERTPGRRSSSSSTATTTRRGRRPSSTPLVFFMRAMHPESWTVDGGGGVARRGL